MAVTIATPDAESLLENIRTKLAQSGIAGWKVDGDSYTLTAPEWSEKAWIRAFPEQEKMVLGLVPKEGEAMTGDMYAVFHARLVEMLLTHFRSLIIALQITSQVTYPDLMHWTGESQHTPHPYGEA